MLFYLKGEFRMSHHDKIEQVLDFIINEEAESAADLLHDIIIEKARVLYDELVNEEEMIDADSESEVEEDTCNEEDKADEDDDVVEENFGGDLKDDFAQDIEQSENEIESDEMYDDAEADVEDDFGDEIEAEGDLEDKFEELRAMFDEIQAELGIEAEDDVDEGMYEGEACDEEASCDEDYVAEATKMQHEVSVELNGEKDADEKEAPFTKAPHKESYGGEPTKFAKSVGDGKQVSKDAKKHNVEDNIDVPEKSQSADLKGEGNFSGTGKNSKKGSVQAHSPLTKKPS